MRGVRYQDFYKQIDYDLLYADLCWEPIESYGPEDKGYCFDPWKTHKNGDTTGKLAINRDKGVYNCWVCGGGTILSLVMEVKKLSPEEATTYLFNFTRRGKASPQEFYQQVSRLLEEDKPVEKPLPHFNENVIKAWVENEHEWFAERGITDEIRRQFRLGFNPSARTFKKSLGVYEGPAIILPHYWRDQLVGWQNRWLDSDRPRWVPKYTNTTDFPRETTLWGFTVASTKSQPPILVESVPTACFLLSEGYSAIGTFGSQITPVQLRHLRGYQSGIMLAPDNDEAGRKWLQKATEYLERYIKILHVPSVNGEGADLGDLSAQELSTHLKGVEYPWPIDDK